MKKLAYILLISLAAALCACTQVPVGEQDLPGSGFVCNLDWSEIEGGRPKTLSPWLSMVSTRVAHAQHFYWEDIYYTPGNQDTVRTWSGEYQSAIILSDTPEAWTVDNLNDYLNDRYQSLRDVYARLLPPTEEELARDFPGFHRILSKDLDTIPQAPSYWTAAARYNLEEGRIIPITFKPQPVTQKVKFRVRVQADADVIPTRLVACVGGVRARVELLSGYLDTEKTAQLLFDLEKTEEGNFWEAEVSLLGIVPSTDASLNTGRGLLTLCAEIGPLQRHFVRVCNLKGYLDADPLLTATQNENLYIGGEKSTVIEILTPFIIHSTDAPYPEGEDPIHEWMEPEDGQTVDLIDGEEVPEEGDNPKEEEPVNPENPEEPENPENPEEPTVNEDENA